MFSKSMQPWLHWDDRRQLCKCPGVYVIARQTEEDIIYIGRTWSKGGIHGRLSKFHTSATTGHHAHSGGRKYRSMFGSEVSELLVSCYPVTKFNGNPLKQRAYIALLERQFIWEYVKQTGTIPDCNSV